MITTFGVNTDEYATTVAVQPDGRIVAAGYFGATSPTTGAFHGDFAIVRYNVDGTLDTTFDGDGKATTDIGSSTIDLASDVAIQPDGRIVAGGTGGPRGALDFAVVRYNADGSLDTSFDTDGKVTTGIGPANDLATGMGLQADGRIVLTGGTIDDDYDVAVVRYDADGTLDTTFGTNGKVVTDVGASSLDMSLASVLQADGKIVVADYEDSATADFTVLRYLDDGSLDTGFGTNGRLITDFGGTDRARSIALDPDGRIVVAGDTSLGGTADLAVARYLATAPHNLVSVGDVAVSEGDSGTRSGVFTVSLSRPSASAVTVDFATADGTATSPLDYTPRSGTLSFAPGTTAQTVKVPIAGDTADEVDERLRVVLSNPVGIGIGDGTGKATIVDDDPASVAGARLAVGDVSVHEGDDGRRAAIFTVSLSGASASTVTVSYATHDRSATRGLDYIEATGSLSLPAATTMMTVKVPILADDLAEGDETFAVTLSGAVGATITDAKGLGSLLDHD